MIPKRQTRRSGGLINSLGGESRIHDNRGLRRWLAYRIYPEGAWNKDMSREIDRLLKIIDDLGGRP